MNYNPYYFLNSRETSMSSALIVDEFSFVIDFFNLNNLFTCLKKIVSNYNN